MDRVVHWPTFLYGLGAAVLLLVVYHVIAKSREQ